MAITAAMVKELREMTGAGMMDCKKALGETDGNMEAAVELLRKNGQAKAEKKASRIAAEGLCKVVTEGDKVAAVVEVNSETDFVAKNEKFQAFVDAVAARALTTTASDIDAFMAEPWDGETDSKTVMVEEGETDSKTVMIEGISVSVPASEEPTTDAEHKTINDVLVEQIAVIGEKLSIRRFEKVEAANGCVVTYTHGGGRIGVIVEAATDVVNDAVKEALTNVAMQVAALYPKYVSSADVSEEYKNHEKEILLAQAKNDPKNANKPEEILEKMIIGRLNKELKEVCLLEQEYVKAENKETVAKYLENVSKANGTNISIVKFVRFETGEGMEKKEENFAEEVAKQMGM